MNPKRIQSVAGKEFKHLLRDYRMLAVLLLFPVFLLVIFGYAVNFDVQNIQLAVLDHDRSELSREFINGITTTGYFTVTEYLATDEAITTVLNRKGAQCVAVFGRDFSDQFYSGGEAKIQFLIDGVDGNTAGIIQTYVTAAAQDLNRRKTDEWMKQRGIKGMQLVEMRPIFLYNPDLKSSKFLVPGLIGMILIISSVISVSLSLVREKERGTIEQLLVSPVSPAEMILGKTLPYILVALFSATFVLLASYFFFDLRVQGSILLLYAAMLLYILAASFFGIFISVVSETQQVAFTIGTFTTLLPSVILSGFIFPIENMPFALQIVSNLTPAKFFIVIIRGIILRGAGFGAVYEQFIYLAILGLFFLLVATAINTKKAKAA